MVLGGEIACIFVKLHNGFSRAVRDSGKVGVQALFVVVLWVTYTCLKLYVFHLHATLISWFLWCALIQKCGVLTLSFSEEWCNMFLFWE